MSIYCIVFIIEYYYSASWWPHRDRQGDHFNFEMTLLTHVEKHFVQTPNKVRLSIVRIFSDTNIKIDNIDMTMK